MEAALLPLLAAAVVLVLALVAFLRRPRASATLSAAKGKGARQTVVADATGEKDERPSVKLLYGTQT